MSAPQQKTVVRQFIGASGLAERLGVSRSAVNKWRERFPFDSAHPFPAPDVEIDGVPGWLPERVSEVEYWRAGLPGRGNRDEQAASQREYLAEARARGLSVEEALRTVDAFADEYPERDREQIYAWLVSRFKEDQPN
ncbi:MULTISPECIES: hypothetical protein [Amycolatopsis]|uniref:Helix-turn-helix domain-containing protein n=1 Tax=Amycolatopsis albidoflavus TaxID=102226 RepID=A0ABW5HRI4_9PSEU